MSRPKKATVDYFPHVIKTGKTLTILENRFKNDGYAFWFKLLEILGSSDKHYFRYESSLDVEYLLAKTRVSEETAEEILNLLAEIGKIDKELWKNRIIWCQNFVDNLEEVYKKRRTELPKKPVLGEKTPPEQGFSGRKPSHNGVLGEETPQSKVKYSIVKESRERPREKSIIPANIGEDTRTPAEKLGTQLKKIHESIQTVPYPIKPGERNKIARLQEDFSDEQISSAWRYFLENINQFKTRQNGSVSIHWFYEKIGDIAQAMLEEKKQQETGGVPF